MKILVYLFPKQQVIHALIDRIFKWMPAMSSLFFTGLKVEQSNQTKFGRKKLCEGILFWSEHKHEILIIDERTEIRFTWMKYKVLRCCSWLSMSLSEAFSDKVRTWTLSHCDIFSTNHEHTMWLVYLIWWLKKHTIFRCKTYIKNKNQWVCTILYSYDVILNSKLSFYPHVCVCCCEHRFTFFIIIRCLQWFLCSNCLG